ncbi:YbfB/YjiJ family MFS transporter [Nocardioides soli]|uniref:MFS family permease n=1 Tax=Nocardioides soli TaxID=1036020 RepID=A0A7W4VWS8_9ACTN|nr:YbfB/YjiJ family MFS transporter [Nocardioides soli]MBB3043095.1 MFS family permease [Nocardioides soli]
MPLLVRSACLLALGVGVGRFVFTPILPLMTEHAGVSPRAGSVLATLNYLGYAIGALGALGLRGRVHLLPLRRVCIVTICLSLFAMGMTDGLVTWGALRFLAGVGGAVLFVLGVDDLLSGVARRTTAAWGFGGVGAGIVLSGVVIALLGDAAWREAWWLAGAVGCALGVAAWGKGSPAGVHSADEQTRRGGTPAGPWPFRLVWVAYAIEGVGYIIIGTFLVAAVSENAPVRVGSMVWVAVGLVALPSCACWTWLTLRVRRATALTMALLVQAVAAALPVLTTAPSAALASGMLFGATIIAVPWLALMVARDTGRRNDVVLMTLGYGGGQVVGPLLAAPLLAGGYRSSLMVAAVVLAIGAGVAGVLAGTRPAPANPGSVT